MKVRKILIFTQSKFTERDYKRFGAEYFIKNNCQVIIYDLTMILRSSFYINKYTPIDLFKDGNVIIPNSVDELENSLIEEKLNSNVFAMCWIHFYYKEIIIFKLLTKHNIEYSQFKLAILPDTRACYIILMSNLFYLFKTHAIYNKINPPVITFLAGNRAKNQIGIKRSSKTKKINCGSFDYNLFIDNSSIINNEINNFPEIVFIDQYWPCHPDFDGGEILNSEFYYSKVNDFLGKLQIELNMTCGIAFHPRNINKINPFFCKGYFNKTIDLIKNAKIVVAHHSTSLSFAILYRKPIIHISFRNIKRTINHKYIFKLSKLLNTPIYYIDDNELQKVNVPFVIEERYAKYIKNFLLDNSKAYTNDFKVEALSYINSKFA